MTKLASVEGWGDAHPPDVVIWPEFPLGDAVMTLDGYDIEICPASALFPAVVFWALSCSMSALEAADIRSPGL